MFEIRQLAMGQGRFLPVQDPSRGSDVAVIRVLARKGQSLFNTSSLLRIMLEAKNRNPQNAWQHWSAQAKSSGVPPVCQNSMVWFFVKTPFLIRSISPPIARAV